MKKREQFELLSTQAMDEDISTTDRGRAAVRYCQSPATFFGEALAVVKEMWEKEKGLEEQKKQAQEAEATAKEAHGESSQIRK